VKRLSGSVRTAGAGLCVLALLLPVPAAAQQRQHKQEPHASPSAEELWREYPLEATPEANAQNTSQAVSPTPTPAGRGPTEADRSSDGPSTLLVVVLAIVATVVGGTAAALLPLRRRRRPGWVGALLRTISPEPRLASGPAPEAAMAADRPPRRLALASASERSGGDREPGRRPRGGAGGASTAHAAPPPDTRVGWTAEIEWRHGPDNSRFCVMATARASSERAAISESEPLEWPPRGPDAVQALRNAVDRLTAAAVAAGWEPTGEGNAWYAKRFRWEAVGAAEPPAAPPDEEAPLDTGRFRRVAWPEETEDRPRCEIRWAAGYVKSQFRAMMHHPGRRRPVELGSSETFKWLLMADPDPESEEVASAIARLTRALRAAGWEPAGAGAEWYAQRFVWPHEEPPPERLESHAAASPEEERS
jgi:hypothetical protein